MAWALARFITVRVSGRLGTRASDANYARLGSSRNPGAVKIRRKILLKMMVARHDVRLATFLAQPQPGRS